VELAYMILELRMNEAEGLSYEYIFEEPSM
jgi:hypothetical protein